MKRLGAAIACLGIVVLGFGVRLGVSRAIYLSNIDSGTVGLMGLHIMEGERPLFFYGQDYMGALEAYMAALLFTLLGPSELALSLSPIFFSLIWMAGTFFLFKELCDMRTGVAAALCLAVPGWNILWYSIGSYGGYPAALACGTWSLWLVLRITRHDLSEGAQWAHILALGFLAGLGLWSNYVAGAYLVTGGVLLVPFMLRMRFRRAALLKFGVGGLFFLGGFWPVLYVMSRHGPGHIAAWSFTWPHIRESIHVLWTRCASGLVFWPVEPHLATQVFVLVLLAVAGVLTTVRLMEALFRERSGIVLVPVLFVALFFLIYLPHAMAHLGALRYLLPVESIAICTLFALPVSSSTPKLSRAGWVVLCLWLAYNAIEMRNVVRAHGPEKRATLEHRELLLAGIAASGLKHALIVSSPVFAHHGHQLTFWTGNRVKFVSAFDERYQPAAQEAEADPDLGLIYETPMRSSVEAALAALGASYNIIEEPWASLVNQIKVPLSSRRSVSPEQLRMELHGDTDGDANAMIDRRYDTAVRGALSSASGFTMDLGEVRRIDGLWLTAPDWLQLKLPAGYRVSVSRDGKKFREVARTDHRIALAYHCGDRVYMKGYFGFQEICFAPVEARYVRYDVTQGQRGETHWKINEVFVMEYLGSTADDWRDDVDRVAESIRAQQIDFTVADRWLSARLWNLLPHPKGRPPVYPRFNPRHRETIVLRDVNPRPGLAIAPALEMADECEARLRELFGDAVEWSRTDGEQYALLSIQKAEAVKSPRRLIWNGHVLLTDEGPRGRVY